MSFNTNPLYSSQWHFNLIGDIETIWAEFSGAGVTVAIYDDGVQSDHPDLDDNYDASQELPFPNNDSYPDNGNMGHGTAVAGIIAGENNGIGGIGVAWGSTIVGNDFFEGSQFGSLTSTETLAMANFDIINNSWGSSGFSTSEDISGSGAFTAGLYAQVAANGRDGLGSIIVKSAGNSARGDYPSSQNDGINVQREVITVGATDSSGNTTDYSSWGSNLLISAPAASFTTDLTFGGYNGLPDTDYTNGFGGTSAAAPVVSGVIALMLEANGDLGWRDVQQILAVSASQTGSAFGSGPGGFEDGSWYSTSGGNWNGGGLTYHINYGFGMIDAFAAVRLAEVWSIIHGEALTSANEVSHSQASGFVGATISNLLPAVQDTISVTGNEVSIETIYVEVNMTHSWAADLTIILVAPDGTEFVLHDQNGGTFFDENGIIQGDDHNGYTYSVRGALGMSSLGDWTLRIEDSFSFDDGTLFSWELDFFGSTPDNDDVYTFTDDYAALLVAEPGRGGINYTNGGIDWMNFAAVTTDVVVDLNEFLNFFLGGAYRQIGNPDQIENIMGGDGNDVFHGNALGNHLLGGRGRDDLYGHAGNDTLEGGQGIDLIFGGAGFDSLLGGHGNDSLDGGDQADNLFGGWGNDTLIGGNAADRLFGGQNNDIMHGDEGNDVMFGEDGNDTMYGGDNNDNMSGGLGFDSMYGGSGDDRMNGGEQADNLFGDEGNDTVLGGVGADRLFGGADNDLLLGGTGNDVMFGESGNDTMNGEDDDDRMFGGSQFDFMGGGDGNDFMDGGSQADNMLGGDGNDTMYGGQGLDRLVGGVGEDLLYGEADNDQLFGWSGDDTIYGGQGVDRIFGQDDHDVLYGGTEGDSLFGGNGNDTIYGEQGNDMMWGDAGADVFVFAENEGHDTIRDFDTNTLGEVIDLSALSINAVLSFNISQTANGVLLTWGDPNASVLLQGLVNGVTFDVANDVTFN